jgi:hypothetical protein
MIQRAVEKETREEMLEVNRKAIAEETQEKTSLTQVITLLIRQSVWNKKE